MLGLVRTGPIHVNKRIHPALRPDQSADEPDRPSDLCPRCGGDLRPTTGIHRILDPRLVCANCGYLWTPAEAAAGKWNRGDTIPEQAGALGYPVLLTSHLGCGSILLLILVLMWVGAERNGWCSSSWDYDSIQKCISGEATTEALRIFRSMVPILAVLWIGVGAILIRKREAGCVTTPVSVLVVLACFFLSIYMR